MRGLLFGGYRVRGATRKSTLSPVSVDGAASQKAARKLLSDEGRQIFYEVLLTTLSTALELAPPESHLAARSLDPVPHAGCFSFERDHFHWMEDTSEVASQCSIVVACWLHDVSTSGLALAHVGTSGVYTRQR